MTNTSHLQQVFVPVLSRVAAVTAVVASLAGCAGSSSSPLGGGPMSAVQSLPSMVQTSSGSVAASMSHSIHTHSANCPAAPSVWASSNPPAGPPTVIGYSGGAPCITITGAPGSPFVVGNWPLVLATDSNGFLYVTDPGNTRVVVFDKHGVYWSTLSTTAGAYSYAVCVSPSGVVGVTNGQGSFGFADFYSSKGPQNSVSGPSNVTQSAPGYGALACAFDRRGDFFATTEQFQIIYLRNYNVNTVNASFQTCTVAICTGSHSWRNGMYSFRRPGTINTLSVVDMSGGPNIVNFRINLGPPNMLTFVPYAAQPTTLLTGFPPGFVDTMGQVAPSAGAGNASKLYLADHQNSLIDYVTNVTTGGAVNPFNALTGAWGVATHPTGQY